MANGIYIEIKRRILDAEEGSIFVTSDFTDIATTTTVRIFDFMSSKIEIENKRIKSHLDDIYYNEVYLFSDEYIQQWEERAKAEAEYYAEHPELYEDTEESEEDILHRKVNEAIWAGDVQTIKEYFPKIDRNNKQIQSELTWSVAKDVMKDKELRKLYYQKYGVKYKLRREKRK